jgi:hypothetical protein
MSAVPILLSCTKKLSCTSIHRKLLSDCSKKWHWFWNITLDHCSIHNKLKSEFRIRARGFPIYNSCESSDGRKNPKTLLRQLPSNKTNQSKALWTFWDSRFIILHWICQWMENCIKLNVWIFRGANTLKMTTQKTAKWTRLHQNIRNNTKRHSHFSSQRLNVTLIFLNNYLSNSRNESGITIYLRNDLI